MRVALVTHSNPFRLALCQGILDADVDLVAVTETRTRAGGLLAWRRRAACRARRAWPSLFSRLSAEPLYRYLHDRGVPCLQVPGVRQPAFAKTLLELEPDLVVLSRFGEILPPELIRIPRLGIVNVHCSLLPQLRGPDPIPGAIIGGLAESGVTMHFVDEGVDTGSIILQKRISLEASESHRSFCKKAAPLMKAMIGVVMRMFLAGSVPRGKQEASLASYFSIRRIFGSNEVHLDWSQPSRMIEAFVRAGVRCVTSYKGKRFRVVKAGRCTDLLCRNTAEHGVILARRRNIVVVSTGDAPLELEVIPDRTQRWWSLTDRHDFNTRRRGRQLALPLPGERFRSAFWPNMGDLLPRDQARRADAAPGVS